MGVYTAAAASGTAVQVTVSAERSQRHDTPPGAPSGSLSDADSSAPACGCSDDSSTVPASSTLATHTVTSTVSSTAAPAAPVEVLLSLTETDTA